ncbi:unnamed protein product [Miscanthus lutarioriparius]|uniref:Uncharacterized protein n=1 Tax=Miscanthus lutarioriparius TaxID=422564 RepID=A0A811SMV2_9POAL|nr:unnamed protein product [Miscanthus lutarioriparius]
MILEGEVSIAKRLDFNVHSDVESVAPDIPAQECTTPHKSFSIPLCGGPCAAISMDNVAGMTGGGQEGASPCAVDAAGMTGEGGQEGGPCTAVPSDDGAGMIGEGCQEENLLPSQDNSSPMVSPPAAPRPPPQPCPRSAARPSPALPASVLEGEGGGGTRKKKNEEEGRRRRKKKEKEGEEEGRRRTRAAGRAPPPALAAVVAMVAFSRPLVSVKALEGDMVTDTPGIALPPVLGTVTRHFIYPRMGLMVEQQMAAG